MDTGARARRIRDMFAEIAPRYDLLNRVLSFSLDRAWRRAAVRALGITGGHRCLDVCTGTADLAITMAAAAGDSGLAVGVDYCEPMVEHGQRKLRHIGSSTVRLAVADAMALPFAPAQFDAVGVGFGLRNVVDMDAALSEMARVTRPAGRIAVLEFSPPPPGPFRPLIRFYLDHVLPRIGAALSRRDAYTYLPRTIQAFSTREELTARMTRAGIVNIRVIPMNLGLVCIHVGMRPAAAA